MSFTQYDSDKNDLKGYEGIEFAIVLKAIEDWFYLCGGKKESKNRNFKELEEFFKTDAQMYLDEKTTIKASEIFEWLQEERTNSGAYAPMI